MYVYQRGWVTQFFAESRNAEDRHTRRRLPKLGILRLRTSSNETPRAAREDLLIRAVRHGAVGGICCSVNGIDQRGVFFRVRQTSQGVRACVSCEPALLGSRFGQARTRTLPTKPRRPYQRSSSAYTPPSTAI